MALIASSVTSAQESPPNDWLRDEASYGTDSSGEAQHVAPAPPEHPMRAMPYKEMVAMMQMDDTARIGTVLLDQFEWRTTDEGSAAVWQARGWYGGDYDKLSIRTEGERVSGATKDARIEALWDRIISRWWTTQIGVRQDFGSGAARTWAALGVKGLAPYWFDLEATLYAGEQGRTAARVKAEYDILLTQRLIIQPEAEANLYGKRDPARQLGSGLSDIDLGIRVRYELRRELAPYIGVAWQRRFGDTAALVLAGGSRASDVQFLAGVRISF